jgi:hypothetical protein
MPRRGRRETLYNDTSFYAGISACRKGPSARLLSMLKEMPQLLLMLNLIRFMVV